MTTKGTMECMNDEEMKTKLFKKSKNFTADELEKRLEKLRCRSNFQHNGRHSTNERDELPVKTRKFELPPIGKLEKNSLKKSPTTVAVYWNESQDGKISRESNKLAVKSTVKRGNIRQRKPCLPQYAAHNAKEEEQKELVCQGIPLKYSKDKINENLLSRDFIHKIMKSSVNINGNDINTTNRLTLQKFSLENNSKVFVGPVFRPWLKLRKRT